MAEVSRLVLLPPEPQAAGWHLVPVAHAAQLVVAAAQPPPSGPMIVAVDGRSGSGKSTFARHLAAQLPGSVVVHTDDVAWYESFFGWDELLISGVLGPARAGSPVRFRPPAWDDRGRSGAIEVPVGVSVLIVEGVGASRESLAPWLDAAIWVQSDHRAARVRGLARDTEARNGEAMTDGTSVTQFWDEWEAQEAPFFAADQPWRRATLIACGTPAQLGLTPGPDEVAVSQALG